MEPASSMQNIKNKNMKAKLFLLLALIFSISVNAQERIISGKVIDETGSEIPGVSISIKHKNVGTTTDINGSYTLKVNTKDSLRFAMIGYMSKEVTFRKGSILNITLTPDTQNLEEVVVVGYATHRKKDVTGAISVMQPNTKNSKIKAKAVVAGGSYDVYSMPAPVMPPRMAPDAVADNEEYKSEKEIGFKATDKDPQTTFSIDVDRAAYTNVRRFIMQMDNYRPKMP